jgi:hypothetical protein
VRARAELAQHIRTDSGEARLIFARMFGASPRPAPSLAQRCSPPPLPDGESNMESDCLLRAMKRLHVPAKNGTC